MAYRGWVFTLKREEKDYDWSKLDLTDVKYIVAGCEEGGKTGYRHYQGFIRFKKTYRMQRIKDWLGSQTVHLEVQKGSDKQAEEYCKKEGNIAFEYGDLGDIRGERTDLKEWTEAIKGGMEEMELWDKYPSQMCRYPRAYEKLKACVLKEEATKEWIKIEVIYIWGKPGSGKTRYAYADDPEIYRVDHGSGGSVVWFDGYEGQKTILFDDFRGNIKHAYMLQLMDGYAMQLQVKGGHTYKNWNKIYITSNIPPTSQYEGVDEASRSAFMRRITKTICLN